MNDERELPEPARQRLEVACPGCSKLALYSSENPFRPFCSQLCRDEDLAAWSEEKYRVPSLEPKETAGKDLQEGEEH